MTNLITDYKLRKAVEEYMNTPSDENKKKLYHQLSDSGFSVGMNIGVFCDILHFVETMGFEKGLTSGLNRKEV